MLSRFLRPFSHSCRLKSSQLSYVHGASNQNLMYKTMGDMLREAVEEKPDKEYFVFKKQNIRKTFKDVEQDARKLAAGLFALGLQRGDRVGVWGHNYYEWVVVQIATGMAGFVQVNINPAYKSRELHYALKTVGVKALITPHQFRHHNYMNVINDICPKIARSSKGVGSISDRELPELEHIIVFGNEEPIKGAWNFSEIWNSAGTINFKMVEEAEHAVQPDDPVNIQYTSGTTGYPKAATLTHHNIVNNAYFTGIRSGWHERDEIICIPNPLYHCFGCVLGTVNALVHKQTCVFPAINYQVDKVIKTIEEEKCTFVFGTPTMFIDLLASPELKNRDMSSVRGGYMAGAPCPQKLCESMLKHLNMHDLYILYGSTELSPVVTMSSPEQHPLERIKTVGTVFPHAEIVIVDEKGKCVPRGEKGELLARGYMTMRGYWGDEERTKRDITPDRWYHTGDTATMNEDGSICIVGRTKDMICRGGENIYPTEIEQFLFKLPYVSDAQVIGVPDDRLGEAVCAWVRLKNGFEGKVTEEKIKEDCKGQITSYKIPKYVLIKEEKDFPLTATGKVKKFELREMSKKLLGLVQVQSHFNS